MATIDSYASTNDDTGSDLWSGGSHAQGQAITLPGGYTYSITSMTFWTTSVGIPTGNAYGRIYAATGTVGTDATPTGSVLGEIAVDSAGYPQHVPNARETFTCTFATAVELAAGNYCVEFYFAGGSGGNFINCAADSSSPSHAGNFYARNGSDTASANSALDTVFYLIGTATKLPSGGSFLFSMI